MVWSWGVICKYRVRCDAGWGGLLLVFACVGGLLMCGKAPDALGPALQQTVPAIKWLIEEATLQQPDVPANNTASFTLAMTAGPRTTHTLTSAPATILASAWHLFTLQ
jgi:hypothetical protein